MRNPISTLLVLTSLVLAGPVRAATVTSSADDGPGSLRKAIDIAAPGETIDFATGLTGPITLTSGELVIGKDLTVQGPGSGTLTIQRSSDLGTPDFRILRVANASVILSRLTLNNGRADYGGGMFNEYSAEVVMRDIILSGNSATHEGGGLFNDGLLALEDSAFLGNSVQAIDGDGAYGGGIANGVGSTIGWLDRCLFQGNSASGGSGSGGGFGGALNNSIGGTIDSMDGCTLQGNEATGGSGGGSASGGAINNEIGGSLRLSNCRLTGNSATGRAGGASSFGGGLNNDSGTVYVDASTVRGNVARGGSGSEGGRAQGGGVANAFGTLELNRSTISGNSVMGGDGKTGGSGEGGGVANDDSGTIYLNSSTVSGNVANGGAGTVSAGVPHGGGLFNGFVANIIVTHSTVAANVVSGGAPNDGGGVFNLLGFVRIKNTIVAANNATVDAFNDEDAETISEGFNCIGSKAGLFTAGPADQFNLTAATLKLGPLQDNGGPTFTHALLCGSPALNAGDNTGAPATDQRGFARIVHDVIDIGAYESANNDTIAPVANVTTLPDATGQCSATIASTPTATDNCSGTITGTTSDSLTRSTQGTSVVTWTFDDGNGNSSTQKQNIVVDDTIAPVANVATLPDATGQCSATIASAPTATDNCSGTITGTTSDSLTRSTQGTSVVTWTFDDGNGNSSTQTQNIVVDDTIAPVANVTTLPDATGQCSATIASAPTATDNCSGTITGTTSDSLTRSTQGTSVVTWTFDDGNGNSSTQKQNIVVHDNIAPTITCPADSSTPAGANCQAAVPNLLASASDNCTEPSAITLSQSPAAGTLVGLGTHTITLTARDAAGNSATCTTVFTVTGNGSLTVNCPAVQSASTDANCQAVVPDILRGVTVSSGCGTPGTISLSQSPAAGTLVGVGTHTITVTATDAAGNSATCNTSFTVTGQNAAIQILTLTQNTDNDSAPGLHINAYINVTWTYLVSNPGCEALKNVIVSDSVAGVIPTYQSGDTNSNNQLDPGEVWVYSASGIADFGQYENIGTATGQGIVSNTTVTNSNPDHYFVDGTPPPPCITLGSCTPAYPFSSANPLTSVAFNESEVLRSSVVYTAPYGNDCVADHIAMFYNDEHAMALGVRRVVVKTATGTTTNDYPISPLPTVPASVTSPLVGSTIATGDQAGVDTAGRPLFPALFVTDITTEPNSLSGDWQYGGRAFPPTAIFGTWKGFVKTVDKTRSPATVTLTADADPAENNWVLGPGSDPVPAGLDNEGYGTEVRWDVSQLGLVTGHRYRVYFIVHDGDQNNVGGDTGQACATLAVPGPATKLAIQAQPSSATAGVPFAQQPVILIEDAYGNLRSSDNSTVVTVTHNTGSGTLQGTLTATAVNGVVRFANLSYNLVSTNSLSFTASGLTGATSDNIVVNPAPFAKLQLLVPGETAAPATASGKTGTPIAQTAGTAFTVTVNAVDANWNLVPSATGSSYTIGITASDANAILPSTANLASGTGTFSITLKTAGSAKLTATDLDDRTKTASTSPAIPVNASAFARLQILVPGETAAPGTSAGKTGTPIPQTATTPFNVTVNAVDANWNRVNSVTDTVRLTSTDTNAVLPANVALVAGTQTLSVTLRTVGTRTVTASDFTDGSKTASTSSSITVGPFAKLQVLVPGETAAPGTATGKTGTPTAQTAGTAFNVTIRYVDAAWNLVSSTHTVGLTSSDASAALPANGALSSGTRTVSVTLKTVGAWTVTATDITDGTKAAATSPQITVNVGAAKKLTIQTQPSPSATAGVPFAQQPVIRVEDAMGNLRVTDNGRVITATRSAGTGTLQGTLTATTVNGIATFANLSHNVANTITLNFAASGLTNATSGNIVVGPVTATQLAFTRQPAGLRAGSPLTNQPVVKAVDAFGNPSSIGLPANLYVSLALTSGSGTLLGTTTLDLGAAAGNGTAAFTNLACSDAGTNKQMTASANGWPNAVSAPFFLGGVERATGGEAIPSSTAGVSYTTLTGPVYYEVGPANAGKGTIILNAPSGFVFDKSGTAPTVLITRLSGTGSIINRLTSGTSAAVTSRSATQITFTVGTASSSATCSLTWQNIRVRPSSASPLASGNLTKTGTSVMVGVTNSSTSFGRLIEIGPAARLAIQTQPSSAATVGVPFAQQPVVRIEDAAGNLLTADNSAVVTATRSSGSGTLQGTTSGTAVNGLATFTDLAHDIAGDITISFASGSLISTTSTAIAVSPAAAPQPALTVDAVVGEASLSSSAAVLPIGQLAHLTGIEVVPNGIKVRFTGSAGYTYQIQRAAALLNANTAWEQAGSATTDAAGEGEFTHLNPTSGQGYYRVVAVQ